MKNGLPETIEELRHYIVKYKEDIYVRERIDGRWGSFSLAEIPDELAAVHIKMFIDEGKIPHRLIRENLPGGHLPGWHGKRNFK